MWMLRVASQPVPVFEDDDPLPPAMPSAGEVLQDNAPSDARIRGVVNDHFDALWRTLRRFGVPESLVDDATQQVFMVACRRVCDIDPGGERRYLFGIAVRVASELRRASGRKREMSGAHEGDWVDPTPGPDELLDQKRARERLDGILDAMAFELRTAFVLYELEGMTLPEIAEAQGIPLGTATSRLRRAREQFRNAVGGTDE